MVTQQFENILAAEQKRLANKFGKKDWRIALYDKSEWEPRVLKTNFIAKRQGRELPAGTVVAAQQDAGGDWTIFHTDLLCKTLVGPNPAKYI